jgi:hypothetical protein
MSKTFSPDNQFLMVNDKVIYHFPALDTDLRSKYFTAGMKHQAKYNLYMLKDVIEYVSEPGERIMDIMAGTGSTMMAATMGRKVTLVEISAKWTQEFIEANKVTLLERFPDVHPDSISIINSACQNVLPLPCDHIIFSPPYSVIMKKKTISEKDLTDDFYGTTSEEFAEYSSNPGNVGGKNPFLYNQMMEDIYQKCLLSVRPGGTMSVIIKDHIEKGQRVYLSDWVTRVCIKAGWNQKDWFKWDALGGPYLKLYRSQGKPTVDDEDIMIFERPVC